MSVFEQMAPNAPPQRDMDMQDEWLDERFREELYEPMRTFFNREGLPAVAFFAQLADFFSMNRNNIVLENAEAHYDELLQKMAPWPGYQEKYEQLQKQRTSFQKLIEHLVIYREQVKTTKKEIKFFPLLENYEKWLTSVTATPRNKTAQSPERQEQSLQKKLTTAYVDYLRQLHGGEDFETLTNLDLIEARALFIQPSSEKYDERVTARHRQAIELINHEFKQITNAQDFTTDQYQLFDKYKKYFSSEQTLPFLVPNEDFYRLEYEKQAQIITDLEKQALFVREDLRRIKFPETAKDRMLPKDVLERIDPRLRALAKQDPDKLAKLFNTIENTLLKTLLPDGQQRLNTKTLQEVAKENTQTQLDIYLGTVDTPNYEGDLTDPQVFASALEDCRLRYKDSLFLDTDIITRLKKQKETMLERKTNNYIDSFIQTEVQEKLELLDGTPADIALRFKEQIKEDIRSKFPNTHAAQPFKVKIWEKITDYIFKRLELELNMQIALATGTDKSKLNRILYQLPQFRRNASCYQRADYNDNNDDIASRYGNAVALLRSGKAVTYHDDFLETLANKTITIKLYHLALEFNK